MLTDLIPYIVILINCFVFKLARSLVNRYIGPQRNSNNRKNKRNDELKALKFIKLFANEFISTCELCADCAELNVVYEKHGYVAYGVALGLLTYLWIETFGDAHTTPGYVMEDILVIEGNKLLQSGLLYVRLVAQAIAMPLAWRFASIYWRYHLIIEHSNILSVENCHSSLTTGPLIGFLIEGLCCLLCRFMELVGQAMVKNRFLNERTSNILCSFISTLLVVLALDTSGGYFNPILASSLEFGCKGTDFWQHLFVFWLGPIFGHVIARLTFERMFRTVKQPTKNRRKSNDTRPAQNGSRRVTRSSVD